MGLNFPNYPGDVQGGDEPTFAPTKNDRGLLGAERGTDQTRRIELDSARNLYVHVAANDAALSSVTALAGGSITAIPAATLSTIVTYTAPAIKKVARIGVSGTIYGTYQLFINTILVETRRSSPARSMDFLFDIPLLMNSGDVMDIKVTHQFTAQLEDFNSTIYGA